MFTDIVGYTSLSQKDEGMAMQLLDEHRGRVRPIFQRHGGREIKTLGDGFLVEFASVLEAVRCAFEIQQSQHELDAIRSFERRLSLRIGIHLGEILRSGEDVYGDAVNIASRIEALARPGGICITEPVQLQVRNRFEFPIRSLGMKTLKNVDEQVEVYELGLPWEKPESGDSGMGSRQLAVLPFVNMSPDPKDEFFADGLTEEMIAEFSEVSEIGVIARTSVMRYKNSSRSVREICRDLGVGYILEGSVRKAGNRIRVTVQLIDTNERHLWTQRYDRELNDIFEVQSEIAEKVATTLETKLRPEKTEVRPPTPNLEAFTLCMRARSLNDRRNKEANEQAIALYNQALKLDPNYAKAIAGLADCFRAAWDWEFMDSAQAKAKTRELAMRAIELDDTLSEPHATLGVIANWEGRWDDADSEFRKAILFNPNYVWAHIWYGVHLCDVGKLDEGLRELSKAKELDPLSPALMRVFAICLDLAGRLDESISEFTKCLKLEPGMAPSYLDRGWGYASKGLKDEALADWETYYNLTKDEFVHTLLKAVSEALWGSKGEAARLADQAVSMLNKAPEKFARRPYSSYSILELYAILGDRDNFFKWLDWTTDRDHTSPAWLRYDPIFREIRGDPRFAKALKKLNVPESSAVMVPSASV